MPGLRPALTIALAGTPRVFLNMSSGAFDLKPPSLTPARLGKNLGGGQGRVRVVRSELHLLAKAPVNSAPTMTATGRFGTIAKVARDARGVALRPDQQRRRFGRPDQAQWLFSMMA